jgi:hypothetical protein
MATAVWTLNKTFTLDVCQPGYSQQGSQSAHFREIVTITIALHGYIQSLSEHRHALHIN